MSFSANKIKAVVTENPFLMENGMENLSFYATYFPRPLSTNSIFKRLSLLSNGYVH